VDAHERSLFLVHRLVTERKDNKKIQTRCAFVWLATGCRLTGNRKLVF
jgi:hypothetical protein